MLEQKLALAQDGEVHDQHDKVKKSAGSAKSVRLKRGRLRKKCNEKTVVAKVPSTKKAKSAVTPSSSDASSSEGYESRSVGPEAVMENDCNQGEIPVNESNMSEQEIVQPE